MVSTHVNLSKFPIEIRELATLIYVKVLYANRVDSVITDFPNTVKPWVLITIADTCGIH